MLIRLQVSYSEIQKDLNFFSIWINEWTEMCLLESKIVPVAVGWTSCWSGWSLHVATGNRAKNKITFNRLAIN